MDNDASKIDIRCRFALEKVISPALFELFSQIPTTQHSKLILVMLERALCYEKQMEAYQNRHHVPVQLPDSPVTVRTTAQQKHEPEPAKPQRASRQERQREELPEADVSGAIRPISALTLSGFGLS